MESNDKLDKIKDDITDIKITLGKIVKQVCLDCYGIKDTENYNLKD